MDQVRVRYFGFGALAAVLVTITAGVLFVHTYRSNGLCLRFEPASLNRGQSVQRAGPWGMIEATELPLGSPPEVIADREERLRPAQWLFEDASEKQVARFLRACALTRFQRRALFSTANWNVVSNGCVIVPPAPLIWFLNGTSRQQIYSVLATSRSNYAQRFPFRFSPEEFEDVLATSGLEAAHLQSIRRLAYTNAGSVCFADLEAMQRTLAPREFDQLVEALYRVPAYALRLRVMPKCDTDALVKYWGKGGREKRVAPLLRSLARVPGGGSINISYFLPPFVRLRLYTFPASWDDPAAVKQDCVFTSLNFFNATPDTNYLDPSYTQKVLETDYTPVNGRPEFGDVAYLLDANGAGLHMCVLIADDFVFTKNGINPAMPWVIMKLADVLATYYPPDQSGKVLFLRRKDLS